MKKINYSEIENQAKHILDKFAKALEKVESESSNEGFVEREKFERIEKEGYESDLDFKKLILDNAPSKNSDFIIAEKGGWK
jgi:hypothetical protein